MTSDSVFVHDEDLPPHIARAILGDKFKEDCHYKLITQPYVTVVVQIDDRYDPDAEPIYDDNGNIVGGHIVEFVLEEDDDDVIPLAFTPAPKEIPTRDIYTRDSKIVYLLLAVAFVSMFIIGLGLISFVLSTVR